MMPPQAVDNFGSRGVRASINASNPLSRYFGQRRMTQLRFDGLTTLSMARFRVLPASTRRAIRLRIFSSRRAALTRADQDSVEIRDFTTISSGAVGSYTPNVDHAPSRFGREESGSNDN